MFIARNRTNLRCLLRRATVAGTLLIAVCEHATAPSAQTAPFAAFDRSRAARHLDRLAPKDYPIRLTYVYARSEAADVKGELIVELGSSGETRITESFPWQNYRVVTTIGPGVFSRIGTKFGSAHAEKMEAPEAEANSRRNAVKQRLVLLHQLPDWARRGAKTAIERDAKDGIAVRVRYTTLDLTLTFDSQSGLLRTMTSTATAKPMMRDSSFGPAIPLIVETTYEDYTAYGPCLFARGFVARVVDGPGALQSVKEFARLQRVEYGVPFLK